MPISMRRIYDSLDHQIGGVSQQQGSGGTFATKKAELLSRL
jgi:hypothetical protein